MNSSCTCPSQAKVEEQGQLILMIWSNTHEFQAKDQELLWGPEPHWEETRGNGDEIKEVIKNEHEKRPLKMKKQKKSLGC